MLLLLLLCFSNHFSAMLKSFSHNFARAPQAHTHYKLQSMIGLWCVFFFQLWFYSKAILTGWSVVHNITKYSSFQTLRNTEIIWSTQTKSKRRKTFFFCVHKPTMCGIYVNCVYVCVCVCHSQNFYVVHLFLL